VANFDASRAAVAAVAGLAPAVVHCCRSFARWPWPVEHRLPRRDAGGLHRLGCRPARRTAGRPPFTM